MLCSQSLCRRFLRWGVCVLYLNARRELPFSPESMCEYYIYSTNWKTCLNYMHLLHIPPPSQVGCVKRIKESWMEPHRQAHFCLWKFSGARKNTLISCDDMDNIVQIQRLSCFYYTNSIHLMLPKQFGAHYHFENPLPSNAWVGRRFSTAFLKSLPPFSSSLCVC